ncbi:MAG: transglutaminase family protein, partial [Planctomycetota bacterium]
MHGNLVELLHIHQPHRQLEVCAESVVTCSRKNLPQVIPVEIDSSLEDWQRSCASQWQLAEFLLPSPHTQPLAELQAWASTWLAPRRSVFQALRDLTQAIHQNFAYAPGSTHINTPLSTVFTQRSGVCQDFAHLMLSALRSAGIPARYVSGYLETLPPPGQERLVGADASHAWVAAYLPAYGWIDYDPTNNCIVGQAHITVAWGRDYDD